MSLGIIQLKVPASKKQRWLERVHESFPRIQLMSGSPCRAVYMLRRRLCLRPENPLKLVRTA